MLCSRRETSTTSHVTMTNSVFQNEAVEQALSLDELGAINGAGFWAWLKEKVKQKSKDIEKKYGDGDGKHEWSDYADELEDILKQPCLWGPCT